MKTIDPDGALPKDFPLQPHKSGQYRKSINGVKRVFGPVSAGWRAALDRYTHDLPYYLQGKLPPPMVRPGEIDARSIEYIAQAFMDRELKRWKRHQIGDHSITDKRQAIEIGTAHLGAGRMYGSMRPDDWADLKLALAQSWARTRDAVGNVIGWKKLEAHIGPDALKRRVIYWRQMARWAERNLPGCSAANFGDEFKVPKKNSIRRARGVKTAKHGEKRFELVDIPRIAAACQAASAQQLAQFLLAIYCGFTERDCEVLPWRAVNFNTHLITWPRLKTRVPRVIFMPDDLEAALKAVQALDLKACDPGQVVHQDYDEDGIPVGDPIKMGDLIFINGGGRPWGACTAKLDKGGRPDRLSHVNGIADRFARVLSGLELKRPGLAFGAGRHTFCTHAARVVDDDDLVKFIMGHAGGMDEWYKHPPVDDLRQVAHGLHSRYFGGGKPALGDAAMRMAS